MNKSDLDQLLFQHTENEKIYLAENISLSPRYATVRTIAVNGKEVLYFHLDNLDTCKIILRKDSRYIGIPFYTYSSININYIYSGLCTYWIDGQELILHKGDVCIFDRGTVRAKKRTGFSDIVININISDSHFQKSIPDLKNQNIISSFLLSHLLADSNHNNYIVFRTDSNQKIMDLFDMLLIEYFENREYSKEIMQNYLSVIILELLLLYQAKKDIHSVHLSGQKNNRMLEILYYIEENCSACTLKDAAGYFGYHTKYLCAYIKKHIGKTFQEIKRECRLKQVAYYLSNTELPIYEVAERAGYTNHNQFYKEFRDSYHLLPGEFRKQARQDSFTF